MRTKLDTGNYLFSNRDLRKLIVPLLVEQFLAVAVGLADSIMVSSVGEAAVSAVSLIDTIMVLLINTFTALATGGAIVAGQYLGQKRREDACRATEQLVLVAAAVATALMLMLYLGKEFILRVVFGEIEADVMANCNTYLLIVAASAPFLALYNVGASIYRGMGDSRTPMLTSLAMNAMNLAGNAFLLYGLKWGVEGAAVPTLLSRVFAGLWMLHLLKNPDKELHVKRYRDIRPDRLLIKKILRVGIPYGLENSMFQLGKIMVLSLVSSFGTMSITANAVANSVAVFSILGGMSMGYALSAVAAQCVGAGDYVQVRYYTRKLVLLSYAGIWIMNLLVVVLLPMIVTAYNLLPETAALTRQLVLCHAVLALVFWPLSFTLPATLRASNDTFICMVISLVSMWMFRVGGGFLLASNMGLGVLGVWIAMTLDWVVRAIFFVGRYRGTRWQISHS